MVFFNKRGHKKPNKMINISHWQRNTESNFLKITNICTTQRQSDHTNSIETTKMNTTENRNKTFGLLIALEVNLSKTCTWATIFIHDMCIVLNVQCSDNTIHIRITNCTMGWHSGINTQVMFLHNSWIRLRLL